MAPDRAGGTAAAPDPHDGCEGCSCGSTRLDSTRASCLVRASTSADHAEHPAAASRTASLAASLASCSTIPPSMPSHPPASRTPPGGAPLPQSPPTILVAVPAQTSSRCRRSPAPHGVLTPCVGRSRAALLPRDPGCVGPRRATHRDDRQVARPGRAPQEDAPDPPLQP
eukprot:scaffold43228_cov264-Isochrysis_galbana.AAC.2